MNVLNPSEDIIIIKYNANINVTNFSINQILNVLDLDLELFI